MTESLSSFKEIFCVSIVLSLATQIGKSAVKMRDVLVGIEEVTKEVYVLE